MGLALKKHGGIKVSGVARSTADGEAAVAAGAVDSASTRLESLRSCDLVVVATPIGECAATFDELAVCLPDTTLITDVASVKQPILELARRLPAPNRFLGGHPMAGRTESGLAHAAANLFEGHPWILTPFQRQELDPFQWWVDLVAGIGAQPLFMGAEEHDRQAAFVSHLAFTLSAAYAATVETNGGKAIAGTGFRSMSRLAGGDPRLYADIATANRDQLLHAIDAFTETLERYRRQIDSGDQLAELFSEVEHAGA